MVSKQAGKHLEAGHEKLGPMGDRCDARTVIDFLLETASILVMGYISF